MAPYYEDLYRINEQTNGTGPADIPKEPVEAMVTLYITLILSPIFLLVGTVNNALGVVVMYRLSYKFWSVCMYLYILSIIDLFILYVECGNNWIYALTGFTENISHMIMVLTEWTCKVYTFVFNLALHLRSWIFVALLIECCVAIKKPHEKIVRRKREHTRAVIIFTGVVLFMVNCHFFWTYGLIKPSALAQIPYTICSYTKEWSDTFQDYVWPWLNAGVGYLAPFIISVVLIVVIVYTKRRNRDRIAENDKKAKQYYAEVDYFNEINTIMRVLGYMFAVVMLLKSFESIFPVLIEKLQLLPNTYEVQVRYGLVETLFKVYYFTFLSMKFCLYLALSHRVRQEVRCIINKVLKRAHKVMKKKSIDRDMSMSLMESSKQMKRSKELTNDTIATLV